MNSSETSAPNVIGNRIGIFSLLPSRRDLKSPWSPFFFLLFFPDLLITSLPDIVNGAPAFGEMRQTRRIIETAARFPRWSSRPVLRLWQNKSIVITFLESLRIPRTRVTEATTSREDYYDRVQLPVKNKKHRELNSRSVFSPPAAPAFALKRRLSCGGGPGGSVGWGR